MSDAPITVAVLMGGPDAERDVSIDSGGAVAAALASCSSYAVTQVIIDRPKVEDLAALGADVVFPALHGPFGEGGPLQQRLEAAGCCFVGSGQDAARSAMDKVCTKERAEELGIATPPWQVVAPGTRCDLSPPLVLKPIEEGSSYGVHICEDAAAVEDVLAAAQSPILAEQFVAGGELTIGIVGDRPLAAIEIVPGVDFYDFDAKYRRDDTRYLMNPPRQTAELARWSLELHEALGCRDLSRVDWMVDDRGSWLLEINTMPGFTSHSLLPMAAAHGGLDMPALCSQLVMAALARSTGHCKSSP